MGDLLVEERAGVVTATFNRPQAKNALNAEIVDALFALAGRLASDRSVRALVLSGAGGAFSAGGDIKEFAAQLMAPAPRPGEADPVIAANRRFGDLLLKIDALPQVVVSLVEGPAFGGAMGFIAVSDVAIAASDAKFSLSETTIGLPPAQIGPFLVRKIGLFRARRLALTGARFSAGAALEAGLVDRVAPRAEAQAALAETLDEIGRCEPGAVAATKRILNGAGPGVDPVLLDRAAADFAACLRAAGREGAAAFARKEPPGWATPLGIK